MQRKNNLLMRKGMAMIIAIAVIVIIATIMALSMTMSVQTTKRTGDLYLYEQAVLLSKSATEYALLQIAESQPCSDLNTSFTQDTLYTIDIGMQYIYYDDPNTPYFDEAQAVCNERPISKRSTLYTTLTTPEQNGSVLMDVRVSVTDATVTSEPIRYFRRTLQKL